MTETTALTSLTIWVIAALFFFIALTYSAVGLGGGSAYTASMVVLGFSSLSIPFISLVLNIVVTTIGSSQFIRYRHASLRLLLPFLLTSVPMAYIGGALQLSAQTFQWVLFVSLLFALARLYLWDNISLRLKPGTGARLAISLLAGALLGLIAGIAGIGGGIYLVPLILILGLGTVQQAAACGAIFVWVNSVAGLAARIEHNSIDMTPYLPLVMAVAVGGLLGSWLSSARLKAKTVEKILGAVVAAAVLMLAGKLF